jgi:hypothetical protein
MLKALLIGRDHGLAWALPGLLHRAGFVSDLISSSKLMRRVPFYRRLDLVPKSQSLIPVVARRIEEGYDWIIVTEDATLREIVQSNLSVEEKLKILPVLSEKDFAHLYSKIGLSHTFSLHGVQTPPFGVGLGIDEVKRIASQLGYPVLLKIDASGGGGGIYFCKEASDLNWINPIRFKEELLVQKWLEGAEIDLSALFLRGKLIHFCHARVERITRPFGPSCLRTYTPLNLVEKEIFSELERIGEALGAHGFVNIGSLQTLGGRFYFEADMRPNAWADTPKYFGEDPAIRIKKWFDRKTPLIFPVPSSGYEKSMVIPYFLRLRLIELLLNRHKVWKFIPKGNQLLIFNLIFVSLFEFSVIDIIKSAIPRRFHNNLSSLKNKIFNSIMNLCNIKCRVRK